MRFPFPGIGIVFDIEGLGGSWYGYQAWRFFMKYLDPKRIRACILVEGDTSMTLEGKANDFCIGIYGLMLDLSYIRETFEGIEDQALRPFHRRFIEKLALDNQPLPIKGHIDAFGRLVTDYWNETDHILCMENGWGYCPKKVPPNLDPNLSKELERLKILDLD